MSSDFSRFDGAAEAGPSQRVRFLTGIDGLPDGSYRFQIEDAKIDTTKNDYDIVRVAVLVTQDSAKSGGLDLTGGIFEWLWFISENNIPHILADLETLGLYWGKGNGSFGAQFPKAVNQLGGRQFLAKKTSNKNAYTDKVYHNLWLNSYFGEAREFQPKHNYARGESAAADFSRPRSNDTDEIPF